MSDGITPRRYDYAECSYARSEDRQQCPRQKPKEHTKGTAGAPAACAVRPCQSRPTEIAVPRARSERALRQAAHTRPAEPVRLLRGSSSPQTPTRDAAAVARARQTAPTGAGCGGPPRSPQSHLPRAGARSVAVATRRTAITVRACCHPCSDHVGVPRCTAVQ